MTKKIKTSDLKSGYHIFGNKGSMWTKNAHIAKSGMHAETLCGIPMLSTNHCLLEDVQEIGCQECIKIYKDETKEKIS